MNTRISVNSITKEKLDLLAAASETNGGYTTAEGYLLPDGGSGLHMHRIITQTYTVLYGKLVIHFQKEPIIILQPGDSYSVPPGTLHGLLNPSSKIVKYRITNTPGHEGFEKMVQILSGLADDHKVDGLGMPTDDTVLETIMTMGDTYFNMAPRSVFGFGAWVRKVKRKELWNQLLAKYCTAW